ncbi:MAG: preprotein translocase subunit SecG [Clostridiales bacterium]|jgi:preprotein translocase subunit SecG|nr:preprotein translocase subunit SecG [Clostridiales bacterium]
MRIFITVIHVIVSLILIGSILMQSGKSAGLSGSISGGAESLLGKSKSRGYEALLAKVTTIGAITFVITSVALVLLQ